MLKKSWKVNEYVGKKLFNPVKTKEKNLNDLYTLNFVVLEYILKKSKHYQSLINKIPHQLDEKIKRKTEKIFTLSFKRYIELCKKNLNLKKEKPEDS